MSTVGLAPSPAPLGGDAGADVDIVGEYPSLYTTEDAGLDLESIIASTFAWNRQTGLDWGNVGGEDHNPSGMDKAETQSCHKTEEPEPKQEEAEAEAEAELQTKAKPTTPSPRRRRRKLASSSVDSKLGLSRHEQSLERNRLAASRCRQKKKEGTQRLEMRFREQAQKKRQLEGDITGLRSEVLGLKNEILRHALYDDGRVGRHLAQMMQEITQGEPATVGASSLSSFPGDSISAESYADDGIRSDASHSSRGQS